MSRQRLWLFRIIGMVVIPGLILLLLELGLRIGGYGYPTAAIVPCRIRGENAFCSNVKFGWRFFPRNIARELRPFAFPAKKPDGSYRIFVLGASAAKGTPEPAFCFGRFLEQMLSAAYTGVTFEVYTAAAVAINSYAVRDIADACAKYDPDLFVVYLGNNEVVGPYGAGTVFSPIASNLFLIRLGLALKSTRVGQLIGDLIASASDAARGPRVWKGMEMFLGNQVRKDDPRMETVYRHFEKNLEAIREKALESGARIIFCTVGSNLKDCPPFASLHRRDLSESETKRWEALYREGIAHEEAGDFSLAADRYAATAAIDPTYADLQFRLGRCLWAMEAYEKALAAFTLAREMDTLRFRADDRINDIVRRVAGAEPGEKTRLADAAEAFARHSPHGATGRELFYEHVHLNFTGNHLLAETVFGQIEKILPVRAAGKAGADGVPLSEKACARALAYTEWDRQRIYFEELKPVFENAPFTHQLYHAERTREMDREMEREMEHSGTARSKGVPEEALVLHRQAVGTSGRDFCFRKKYAALAVDLRDRDLALEQYRFIAENFPLDPTGESGLGFVFLETGDAGTAVRHFERALRILPTSAYAHYNLGRAFWSMGQSRPALDHEFTALALQPNYADVYDVLNQDIVQLFRENRQAEAVPMAERLLSVQEQALGPKDVSLSATLNNLASLYQTTGEYAKAEPLYRRALAIKEKSLGPDDPVIATALNNLAGLSFLMGNYRQAEDLYQRALRVNTKAFGTQRPVVAQNLAGLATVCTAKGEYEKAQRFYEDALAIYSATLGPDHPQTLAVLKGLAQLYTAEGRPDEANALVERIRRIRGKD